MMSDFDKIAKMMSDRDAVLTAKAFAMGREAAEAELAALRDTIEKMSAEFRRRAEVDRCCQNEFRKGTSLAYDVAAERLNALISS